MSFKNDYLHANTIKTFLNTEKAFMTAWQHEVFVQDAGVYCTSLASKQVY